MRGMFPLGKVLLTNARFLQRGKLSVRVVNSSFILTGHCETSLYVAFSLAFINVKGL